MRRIRFIAAMAAYTLFAGAAAGHGMPHSSLTIAEHGEGLSASVTIPVSELEAAMGRRLGEDYDSRSLAAYLRSHISVRSGDRPWPMESGFAIVGEGDHRVLKANLVFTAPQGASLDRAVLHYDAVIHRVASHYALVYWRDGEELKPMTRLQLPYVTHRLRPTGGQKSTGFPLRSQVP